MDFIFGFFPKLKNYGDTYYWNDILLNKTWGEYIIFSAIIVFIFLFGFYSFGIPNLKAKRNFWLIFSALLIVLPFFLNFFINEKITQISNDGTFPLTLKVCVYFLGLLDVLILIIINMIIIWLVIFVSNKIKLKMPLRGMSLFPYPLPILKKKQE